MKNIGRLPTQLVSSTFLHTTPLPSTVNHIHPISTRASPLRLNGVARLRAGHDLRLRGAGVEVSAYGVREG